MRAEPSILQATGRSRFLAFALSLFLALAAAAAGGIRWNDSANDAFPEAVAAWSAATKQAQREAGRKAMRRLRRAAKRGEKRFVIPPGHYRFEPEDAGALVLKDLRDFEIVGEGATFWMGLARKPGQRFWGLRFVRCRDVTLRGLTLDCDPLHLLQAEIVALHPKTKAIDFRYDATPGYLPLELADRLERQVVLVFYDRSGRPLPMQRETVSQPIQHVGGAVHRLVCDQGFFAVDPASRAAGLAPGHFVAINLRGIGPLSSLGCGGLLVEDVTVYHAPGAVSEDRGPGGNVYRRLRIVRRPDTQRLVAACRGATISGMMRRGPTYEACEFAHAGDDFINVHGFWAIVWKVVSPAELRVIQPFRGIFAQGSTVRFHAPRTVRLLGSAKVTALAEITDREQVAEARRAYHELEAKAMPHCFLFRVTTREPLPDGVGRLALVECDDAAGRGYRVRDCRLHDNPARAVFLRGSGIIEGTRIENCHGIQITAPRLPLEGNFPRGIVVRNNSLIDCAVAARGPRRVLIGAISVARVGFGTIDDTTVARDITIEGNTIVRPGAAGIFVTHADGVRIRHNTIIDPGSRAPLRSARRFLGRTVSHGIYIDAARRVLLEGNRFQTDRSPTSSLRSASGPTATRVTSRSDRLRLDKPSLDAENSWGGRSTGRPAVDARRQHEAGHL
ncbi:MAG: right-handed parallel beta-helix repeat-containing protein [Planctomycetota bacterium]